ncbi:MAG: Bug family tripartite tricarboxylate transporter substrate binding protein [Lautropia sp.]
MHSKPIAVLLLVCAILVPKAVVAADAESYPSRPIKFVTPYGPGGGGDFVARLLAEHVSKELKQPIVVENKPGGSGTIGADYVAKSAPDGYTVLLGYAAEIAIAPGLLPNIPYEPVKDFVPVTVAASYPLVLVTNPKLGLNTVDDIVAAARRSGGNLAYASSGSGSPAHIGFELLARSKGISLLHVPYKGAGPALTDVLGGHVPMYFASVAPAVTSQIKSSQLRAVVVSTSRRAPTLPDVPGMAEAGVPNLDLDTWQVVLVPAGTPAAIVARLNTEITKVLQRPEVARRLNEGGAHFKPMTPAEASKFIHGEIAKYRQAVRELGIKPD